MKCRACELPNRPGARFCHRCSAPLAPSCIGCGAPLPAPGELCPACRTDRVPEPITDELFADDDVAPTGIAPAYPLVASFSGRTAILGELESLCAAAAADSELRFAVVVAEPGLGKSRTIKELARRIVARDPETRLLVGAGERGAIELGPFAQVLAARFGITRAIPQTTPARRSLPG